MNICMKRLKIFTIIDGIVALLSLIGFYCTSNIPGLDPLCLTLFLLFMWILIISSGIFALCLFILLVSFFIKRPAKPLILFLLTDFILVLISGGVNDLLYKFAEEKSTLYHIGFTITGNIIFFGFILFVYALLILIVTALIKISLKKRQR